MKTGDRNHFSLHIIPSDDGKTFEQVLVDMSEVLLELMTKASNAYDSPSEVDSQQSSDTGGE